MSAATLNGAVLVTGGAGFIGSHVAEAYLAADYEVTVLDDLSSGRLENVPAGARFVHADEQSPEARELLANDKFAILNHHAAQIDVRYSVANPAADAGGDVLGLLIDGLCATLCWVGDERGELVAEPQRALVIISRLNGCKTGVSAPSERAASGRNEPPLQHATKPGPGSEVTVPLRDIRGAGRSDCADSREHGGNYRRREEAVKTTGPGDD